MLLAYFSQERPPLIASRIIGVGSISNVREPDLCVLVEEAGILSWRIELFGDGSEEAYVFQEIQIWGSLIAVGYGHYIHFFNLKLGLNRSYNLDSYFGHIYSDHDYLLVASGMKLFRYSQSANLIWRSSDLGIDGVVVDRVANGIVSGQGEWDPPGGWIDYTIDLDSGQSLS
ncbi:hypothetical protein P12x_002329 [Tundrisphaera lichenicola]|uniref:hypothetical protein n=1 Tax=Tundrisphaera lichenicola TaxID=2029860 RepID=UPI003EBDCABC